MKKGDFWIVAIVLLLAGSIYGIMTLQKSGYEEGQLMAKITVDGREYETVALTKEERIIDIRTEFGHNTLKVYDYGIRMTYSDAPKRIALDMGFISEPYQQIICIPTRVMVQVLNPPGGTGEELDGVIG